MRNNKKKPSVFKNILIIAGCMLFASLYAVTALYVCDGLLDDDFYATAVFTQKGLEQSDTQEEESLPAWAKRVEIS